MQIADQCEIIEKLTSEIVYAIDTQDLSSLFKRFETQEERKETKEEFIVSCISDLPAILYFQEFIEKYRGKECFRYLYRTRCFKMLDLNLVSVLYEL